MAAVRHLEFSKFRVYVCHVISMAMLFFFLLPRAKFEMDGWMDGWIPLKSDNQLLSYDQKRFLKLQPFAIFNF